MFPLSLWMGRSIGLVFIVGVSESKGRLESQLDDLILLPQHRRVAGASADFAITTALVLHDHCPLVVKG
jgi:hypothetical protein